VKSGTSNGAGSLANHSVAAPPRVGDELLRTAAGDPTRGVIVDAVTILVSDDVDSRRSTGWRCLWSDLDLRSVVERVHVSEANADRPRARPRRPARCGPSQVPQHPGPSVCVPNSASTAAGLADGGVAVAPQIVRAAERWCCWPHPGSSGW